MNADEFTTGIASKSHAELLADNARFKKQRTEWCQWAMGIGFVVGLAVYDFWVHQRINDYVRIERSVLFSGGRDSHY